MCLRVSVSLFCSARVLRLGSRCCDGVLGQGAHGLCCDRWASAKIQDGTPTGSDPDIVGIQTFPRPSPAGRAHKIVSGAPRYGRRPLLRRCRGHFHLVCEAALSFFRTSRVPCCFPFAVDRGEGRFRALALSWLLLRLSLPEARGGAWLITCLRFVHPNVERRCRVREILAPLCRVSQAE